MAQALASMRMEAGAWQSNQAFLKKCNLNVV